MAGIQPECGLAIGVRGQGESEAGGEAEEGPAPVVAIPVAVLVFRLRGHYFAIGTWIVAEVFRLLASQISLLGGGSGTSLPAATITPAHCQG